MNKPNNMQSLDQLIDKCRELKGDPAVTCFV